MKKSTVILLALMAVLIAAGWFFISSFGVLLIGAAAILGICLLIGIYKGH